MRDGHAVLRERCLVGADDRGRPEGLDTLEVLHEAVLARHALGGQCQANLSTVIKYTEYEKNILRSL